jgi:thiosulfate/3-mercaptopyruvate sulfurtransferase
VAAITASFGQLGISNDTAVVVYDSDNGAIAARTWWTLRWLGHTNVRLLDGGMNAWQQEAYPLSAATVLRQPVEFVSTVRDELVIATAEIQAAARHGLELNLFDARDATRFSGEEEPIDAVAGHIPGARCLPFAVSLTDDGHWKSVAALRELWQSHLGPDTQQEWVVMCGSGVTACHLALSAVAAGYRDPRLYAGSWSEWITDPGRPVALGLG